MSEYRNGDGDRDNRARTPTKGLRLRLRTALRARGVTGKFRTDEWRRYGGLPDPNGKTFLIVMGDVSDKSLTVFDGHTVIYTL